MRPALFAIATGLLGAAVLHLIIILALPAFTGLDAYTRLSSYENEDQFLIFSDKRDEMGFSNGDPYLRTAACLISVEQQPVHLLAEGNVPFWSFSVYDSSSNEVFSMNDRSATGGELDAIIASPAQLAAIRKSNPDVISQSVLIEMPRPEGYVVLRTLAPSQSYDKAAQDFLADASCESFEQE
ncbi:DUF1254 domain-containing protein [Rhizobium sp. KVB221]|uniref:DUF1254 domain-containing protein n=1 Tax=Rhizobium setariae TaxID=2801340 RepID=A0A937CNT8_9HYPH|nr:DUF1254 domain-containing protein [Rhizobium setariae]MBL0371047.1 DUF1254 domain-containing protein [Rhizobium setariae]